MKHLSENHVTLVTKEFRKAVMKRTRLKQKKQNKPKSAQFRANQPKLCGNYSFPQNFHTRKVGETTVIYAVKLAEIKKVFGKTFFIFSSKMKSKERITLTENENITSNDKKVTGTFHEFFSKVVKTLNIFQNLYLLPELLTLIQSSSPLKNFPNTLV